MSNARTTLPDGQHVAIGTDGAKMPRYWTLLFAQGIDSSRWRKASRD